MEKLTGPLITSEPPSPTAEIPALDTSFNPVDVLRQLGPYGRFLDLEPGISKAPDPEFIFRLVTGHPSHQAALRQHAGDHYKNLENLIRGKHKVSSTSKQLMAGALGWKIEDVEKLEGSAPEGPLLPMFLQIFHTLEGWAEQAMDGILGTEATCPCCGKNMLADVDLWWAEHAAGVKPSEYRFAERILRALFGLALIERLIFSLGGYPEASLDRLSELADHKRHPIGTWLLEVQTAMSCANLDGLATKMQLQGLDGFDFSYGKLKKWSAGQNLMPQDAGEAIAEAAGQARARKLRLLAARTIALVTDFVIASLPEEKAVLGRKHAQSIVQARLKQLDSNVRLALALHSGKKLRPAKPSELPENPSL